MTRWVEINLAKYRECFGASRWTLRALDTPDDLAAAEDLQRVVWPGSETDLMPAHFLLTAAHNGGLTVGAFADDRLVGYTLGFVGLDDRWEPPRLKHCSHHLGVHPDYRNWGIGFDLKRAQWFLTRAQGMALVTWTFDPLLGLNAQLNIAKLGVVCNTYLANYYGEVRDELNAGLPTDRFLADWWLASDRVVRRMEHGVEARPGLMHYLDGGAVLVNPPAARGVATPPEAWDRAKDVATVIIEIPSDFFALKAADMDLALAWRLRSRAAFTYLFDGGFIVTNFVRERQPRPRSFYVLSRANPTPVD